MSTAQQNKVAGGATDAVETPRVVRLSINLAPTVAEALKTTATKQGVSITEAVRRAVALWRLVSDAQDHGNRVMVVEGRGDDAQYREIVLL